MVCLGSATKYPRSFVGARGPSLEISACVQIESEGDPRASFDDSRNTGARNCGCCGSGRQCLGCQVLQEARISSSRLSGTYRDVKMMFACFLASPLLLWMRSRWMPTIPTQQKCASTAQNVCHYRPIGARPTTPVTGPKSNAQCKQFTRLVLGSFDLGTSKPLNRQLSQKVSQTEQMSIRAALIFDLFFSTKCLEHIAERAALIGAGAEATRQNLPDPLVYIANVGSPWP